MEDKTRCYWEDRTRCYCTFDYIGEKVTGHPIEMEYLGNKKYRCPKCKNIEDYSNHIYIIKANIEKEDDWNILKIIDGEDRINKRFFDDPECFVIKNAIEDDFHETLDDWLNDHETGIFDIEVYYEPTKSETDCGTEYDLIMFVVSESKPKEPDQKCKYKLK